MDKRHFFTLLALFLALPLVAENNGDPLFNTLKELRHDLKRDYQQMSMTKQRLSENYQGQHQKMVDIMKQCNEVTLTLYSRKQDFTFDISYTLENVKREFQEFEKDTQPYNSIVSGLDIEIERYARLIESLRRLPPELDNIEGVPDSLLYHNDTLDIQHEFSVSQLEKTIQSATLSDTLSLPFVLDTQSRRNRDSCIFYASELLKMYYESKAIILADSIHYNETHLRLKESYDYATKYYKLLQRNIFIEGQTPWPVILSNFKYYWEEAKDDFQEKYALTDWLSAMGADSINPIDTLMAVIDTTFSGQPESDSLLVISEETSEEVINDDYAEDYDKLKRFEYSIQLISVAFLLIEFLLLWLIARVLLWPIFKWVKPVKRIVHRQQWKFYAMLLGIVGFLLFNMGTIRANPMLAKAFSLANTFLWLLAAIVTALLIRLKPEQLKSGFRLYRPTIYLALFVIG